MTRLRAVFCISLMLAVGTANAQPLFDYVRRLDSAFRWERTDEKLLFGGVALTNIKMTSQVWQGLTWTHRVQILRAEPLSTQDTALLLITGGTAGDKELALLALLAKSVGAPLVILGDIPNQPLLNGLSEDALVAQTFCEFIKTGDASWPLLFPMTKAAVRAMDCAQQYAQQTWKQPIRKFVVTGASKRGWTTWLTGAVDPKRVCGIVPMVYDNLNLSAQIPHQIACYGTTSSQIHDYTERGLPQLMLTPAGRKLGAMVDPYTYRSAMTMPKLIVSGTNDEYWVLDSANLYFDDLPTPRYMLYVPNSGHGLKDVVRVINGEIGFFRCCAGQAQFPKLEGAFEQGRSLRLVVTSDQTPKQVLEWTASSPTRDFRQAVWQSRVISPHGNKYVCHLRQPESGFAAIFAEATYDQGGRDYPVSTNVRVVSAK
jgi:PhoPQ-activated pathogenicity-related protein